MSNRDNPYSIEMLLIEYMLILREQTAHQSNVIQSFLTQNQRNFEGVRSLMQRYLETLMDNRREETHNQRIGYQSRNPQQAPVSFFHNSGVSNIGVPSLGRRTRNYVQSPLSSSGLRRRNVRNPLRTNRPVRRRRNLLNQILETTLYTSNPRRPARATDIS